jgi:DNA-binding winged helix-turn-helix (wHTH) protein/tetratricopeptide (TPR) repeat protein
MDARIYRFGIFEVSAASRELSRHGRRIRLQDQPFELLLLLLEHPGEVVEREDLRKRLWPEDTFVDFGQSLSTAVTKLRQTLGDDANNPRFIETIPRRGYRFIAPVTVPIAKPDDAPSDAPATSPPVFHDALQTGARKWPSGFAWHRKWTILASVILAVLLAVLAAVAWYERKAAFALAPKDTIVLADFENTTGESIFNDALRQALVVGLAQSPLIQVLSDRRSAVVFKQMGHSPEERITGLTAVELCKRVGGKVTVQGSISNLGTTYLVGLAAIRCDTGKPIAHEQVEAAQREQVINALGNATSKLRARLGESLPSIQKYNAPLEQATTSSLEALNAYGQALSTWDAKGDLASLPFFERAIQLDPNFAMAYGGLATVYSNLGKADLARENTIHAFNLRERVTETERTSIEARYYLYVTDEVDKAEQTYNAFAREFPDSAGSLNHLGTTDLRLGRDAQAADDFRKAMLLDPTRAATYGNLALALMRMNRIQEAQDVLANAEKRGLRTGYLLQIGYWLAFLNGNQGEMDRTVLMSSDFPGAKPTMLALSAETEAYRGRYEKALSLSRAAAELLQAAGDKESAARCLAQAAVREAEIGDAEKARGLIHQAGKLNNDKVIVASTALVSAEIDDRQSALALSGALDKQYPHGTFEQSFWLPVIRAEMRIRQGMEGKAVSDLSSAQPLDAAVAEKYSLSPLLPAYVLGQAYLKAGDGNKAGDEFQKLIDQRGMVANSPFGALAWLGRARSYAKAGRIEEARKAYEQFFRLWKDADPRIPLLREAHSEAVRIKAAF